MSVKPIDSQRSFYHTDYLCAEFFGSANRYRLFRERIWPKLLELRANLHSLYCADNGRPAVDPVRLAGVTLFQFMEKVADRAAAECVVYHLGWKYALDLALDDEGFHPTVLVYFRDRLQEKGAERVVLEDLEEEVGGNQRPEFWERLWVLYVQSKLDWRLGQSERQNRYRQCGQDIQEVLEWIDRDRADLGEREALKLLRRVFGEQFEVVEGKLQPRLKRCS